MLDNFIKQLFNNSSIHFDYETLLIDPELSYMLSGTSKKGDFDYENVFYGIDYTIPNLESEEVLALNRGVKRAEEKPIADRLITGFKYVGVDNDNDLFTTAPAIGMTEGSSKLNKFIIKTKFGHFGYAEGDNINVMTSVLTKPSYFFYTVSKKWNYHFGNNLWATPKVAFYIDSNDSSFLKTNIDIEKYFPNSNGYISIGNNSQFKINFKTNNDYYPIDVKHSFKNSTYSNLHYNNYYATPKYVIQNVNLKGSNTEIDDSTGFSIQVGKTKNDFLSTNILSLVGYLGG